MDPGLVWVVLFLVAAGAVWLMFGRGANTEEVEAALRDGVLVVDVRTAGEFATGRVKGALNVPVQELSARIGELGAPGKVLIYCRSGMRSGQAGSMLRSAGFEVIDAKRITSIPAQWLES